MTGTERQAAPEFVVAFNPGSGSDGDGATPEAIERLFADRGRSARAVVVEGRGSFENAVSEAVSSGASCVVAAGGDGTISGTVNAMVGSGLDLGVLPGGTFNYFARRFGIPADLGEAVDVICQGRTREIDLGEVNGRVFINNASLGLYPSVLEQREQTYRRWGRSRIAAYWSVLVTMATVYRPMSMRISVDGKVQREKSPTVFVSVSDFQLEKFGIAGGEAIRNGEFAVLLAPDCGRFQLVWKALKVALRGVTRGRDFSLLTGRDIVVETRQSPRLVARDGERERLPGPYEFRVLSGALRLRLPRPESSGA